MIKIYCKGKDKGKKKTKGIYVERDNKETLEETIVEVGTLIESVNDLITGSVKDKREMAEARAVYLMAIQKPVKRIQEQVIREMRKYRPDVAIIPDRFINQIAIEDRNGRLEEQIAARILKDIETK